MTCSKCGKDLPTTEFYKSSRHKSGYRQPCKTCYKPKEYISVDVKVCTTCGKTFPSGQFKKDSTRVDGLKNVCVSCDHERGKRYRKRLTLRDELPTLHEKRCCRCGEIKGIDHFYRSKNRIDGYTESCIECREKIRKQMELKDPDVYKKRWAKVKKSPEAMRKKREYASRYRFDRVGELRLVSKKSYLKNKKYYLEYSKNWYKTEKGLALVKKKHAVRRMRGLEGGRITAQMIRDLEKENIEAFGVLTCVYCNKEISGSYHLEHKIPLSRGGTNEKGNLTVSCATCNVKKHTMTDKEFVAAMKRASI